MHEVLTERRDDDVDLGELVDRLRSMLVQGLGAGKHVSSRLEPVSLHGERATALALVFCELLGNALEHGGDEVQVELARANGRVHLTVADNGSWSGGSREGTGLSIVRALVREELDGELQLVSDGGLRAEVAFPAPSRPFVRMRPATTNYARESGSPTSPTPGSGLALEGARVGRDRANSEAAKEILARILIAEDETIIRLDLREILERAGFEVCAEARDGEEAVELALSGEPDLAILDVKMPRLDGIEAARRILGERPIPIVILTAYGQDELVSRAVEAGVFGYLVKPFREADLLPAIHAARARHAELQALREEAESLAEALATRKVVERAKGLLMAREGLSEEDAFARLRRASQVSGRPMRVVAEALIATFGEG